MARPNGQRLFLLLGFIGPSISTLMSGGKSALKAVRLQTEARQPARAMGPYSHLHRSQQPGEIRRLSSEGSSVEISKDRWRNRRSLSSSRRGRLRVHALTLQESVTADLFATSLFPYLGFLYYISRKEVGMNFVTNFGFQFLVAFVVASIPASLYAISHYQSTLSDVDWLHGSAEGLLTVTNLLIVLGLRLPSTQEQKIQGELNVLSAVTRPFSVLAVGVFMASVVTLIFQHPVGDHEPYLWGVGNLGTWVNALEPRAEPDNALSVATWMVHWSSLIEWVVAMRLIWGLADRTGNEEWKQLTWAMVPLHTSAVCAVTYHVFFNDKSLALLQTIQASTTLFGNGLMMYASYKIAKSFGWGTNPETEPNQSHSSTEAQAGSDGQGTRVSITGEPLAADSGLDGSKGLDVAGLRAEWWEEMQLVGRLVGVVAALSYVTKYGATASDMFYHPDLRVAIGIVGAATAANILQWMFLDENDSEDAPLF
ncbi:hypothetical protein AAMO2058_000903300 [Amorphochlora amoebiformis]